MIIIIIASWYAVGGHPSRISRDVPDLCYAVPRPSQTSPRMPDVPEFQSKVKMTKIIIVTIGLIGLTYLHTTTTVLWPFFRDHPGEPVLEENFWTLWCKGRLTEADTPIIRLGATPTGLTSAHLHYPPIFFTGRIPFLPPNQQRQSTEGLTYLIN